MDGYNELPFNENVKYGLLYTDLINYAVKQSKHIAHFHKIGAMKTPTSL